MGNDEKPQNPMGLGSEYTARSLFWRGTRSSITSFINVMSNVSLGSNKMALGTATEFRDMLITSAKEGKIYLFPDAVCLALIPGAFVAVWAIPLALKISIRERRGE